MAALAAMTVDLNLAWDHAVQEDPALAVELAALTYDDAYPRLRRDDLLDWGLQIADWEVAHRCSRWPALRR